MTPLLLKLVFGALPTRVAGSGRGRWSRRSSNKAQSSFIDPQIAAHTAYWEARTVEVAEWFAGDAFSAADIMMSFPLEAGGQPRALWRRQAEAEGLPADASTPARRISGRWSGAVPTPTPETVAPQESQPGA